jgi:VIT1/CCC1 family predicted Fe2+/Mn2+ transporter
MEGTRATAANGPAESHRSGRAGWLRAAVLGADDGIVSTASLVIGVAAAAASRNAVLVAGVAGLVAGATSMAAGSTCRSAPSVTPSRLTSPGSGGSWPRLWRSG